MDRKTAIIIAIAAVLILVFNSVFIVHEGEDAPIGQGPSREVPVTEFTNGVHIILYFFVSNIMLFGNR